MYVGEVNYIMINEIRECKYMLIQAALCNSSLLLRIVRDLTGNSKWTDDPVDSLRIRSDHSTCHQSNNQ